MTLKDLLSEMAADITEADGAEAPTYNSTAETRAAQCSIGWNPWHGCTKVSPGLPHTAMCTADDAFGIWRRRRRPVSAGRPPPFRSAARRRRRESAAYRIPHRCSTVMTSLHLRLSPCRMPTNGARDCVPDMMREPLAICRFVFFHQAHRPPRPACLPADWEDGLRQCDHRLHRRKQADGRVQTADISRSRCGIA